VGEGVGEQLGEHLGDPLAVSCELDEVRRDVAGELDSLGVLTGMCGTEVGDLTALSASPQVSGGGGGI